MNPRIDLTKNPKQADFFYKALSAAKELNPFKYLGYGGAIRGGKTFVSLATLMTLLNIYKGARAHIFRQDFPALQDTTIPSAEKLLADSDWKWNRDKSNYFAYNKHDSKLFFKGENLSRDPDLNGLLGMETNFILLEQAEELSKKLWEKSLERVGSWYIDPMPKGLIMTTFNPTQRWVKDLFYTPYVNEGLPSEYLFISALPNDNPFVTADQWAGWSQMAERYRKQFIGGDWTDFDGLDNRWCFAFDRKRHTGPVKWNPAEPTVLSFDFNRNPIVATVWQHYGDCIYGIEVISLPDSTIYRLCQEIQERFPGAFFLVTGDVSGKTVTTVSNLDNFAIIKNTLGLSRNQMQYHGANPPLRESRQLVNALFEQCPIVLDAERCKPLIFDLENVKVRGDGQIVKDNRANPAERADCLDTMRYYMHRYFRDISRIYIG